MAAYADDGASAASSIEPRAPTRRYQAKRRSIVLSAVEELNRKGVRGMTLGDVAGRLNLVPTGIIYYFKNKEELAANCFLRGIERYEALISASEATDTRRIDTFVRAYFEFRQQVAGGESEEIAVFNDVRALNSPSVNQAYTEMFRHARALLVAPAVLPRLHINARTHLLLSQMFWAVAWIHRHDLADYGRVAERVSSLLTAGLAAPGVRVPRPQPLSLVREGDPSSAASSELFLRAATDLINQEGYHGASVERISARLNVSKGAFYHHNETKDELVVACFQRTFDILWRAIHDAERLGGSGLQILVSVSTALVEHQLEGGAPLLRTSAFTAVPESIHAGLMAKFDRLSLRFASIICDGIADGSVRAVDANVAAQMLTGMINAAAELHFWAPGLTPQNAADHYVRPFFEGLTSPAAA